MGLWPQLQATRTLVVMGPGSRSLRSLVRDDVNFASEFVDSFSTSKEGFKSSLRAKRSNPQPKQRWEWIASSLRSTQ